MSEAANITVRVPLTIRRQAGRKTVVMPSAEHSPAAVTSRSDPVLVKAPARAFRYQRLLDDGRYASISEMAEAERIDRGYLGRILQLTLLEPTIVEAILDGRQPPELRLPRLVEPFAADWSEQRRSLLNTAPAPELASPPLDGGASCQVPRTLPACSPARTGSI